MSDFNGGEICSLSIELQVCEAWRKGRPCGEVCQWQRDL